MTRLQESHPMSQPVAVPEQGSADPPLKPASQTRRVIVLLVPCGVAMVMGLDAALVLLGLPAPLSGERFSSAHGIIMTIGFLEALVSLESAVSLRRLWAYCAPAALAVGALLVLTPLPLLVGQLLMLAGCALLIVNYSVLWTRKHELMVAVQVGGALAALGAVLLWTGGVSIPDLFAWLVTFLVLTIAAERVVISRFSPSVLTPAGARRYQRGIVVISALIVFACPLTTIWSGRVLPVFGLALIALTVVAAWGDGARSDLRVRARATVAGSDTKSLSDTASDADTASGSAITPSQRFTGVMVFISYLWLIVTGLLLVHPTLSGLHYDALLHAVFLGFVMTMVVAHVPTYLPFLLEIRFRFNPGFWGVAVLLNVGLVVRIVADLAGSETGRTLGGLANIAALLSLVAVAVWAAVVKGPEDPPAPTADTRAISDTSPTKDSRA